LMDPAESVSLGALSANRGISPNRTTDVSYDSADTALALGAWMIRSRWT